MICSLAVGTCKGTPGMRTTQQAGAASSRSSDEHHVRPTSRPTSPNLVVALFLQYARVEVVAPELVEDAISLELQLKVQHQTVAVALLVLVVATQGQAAPDGI